MGLDMYLYAERYRSNYCGDDKATETGMAEAAGLTEYRVPDNFNSTVTRVQAAYWRKANAIHQWFVNEVQDGRDECQLSDEFGVSVLERLVATCKQVLDDPATADVLLPTQAGFFFGGTDLDEWYFDYLRYTVERLGHLIELAKNDRDITFRYQSSW